MWNFRRYPGPKKQTEKPSRQYFGEEFVTVEGFADTLEGDSTIHLYPRCSSLPRTKLCSSVGKVTVAGTRICIECKKKKIYKVKKGQE